MANLTILTIFRHFCYCMHFWTFLRIDNDSMPLLLFHDREFGFGSSNNPLIGICIYSHHLSALYCIDIVRRNSVLVTYGGERVKES